MSKNISNMLIWFGLLGCLVMGTLWPSPTQAADDEFKRVRRIYIEGARFMQEKRYTDAVPMLAQAYTMLNRAVKGGSKNKRSIRALRKLRYFLGFSHYQVGATKSKSQDKDDKAFTRGHFTKAVPLLKRYATDGKSEKRRKEAAKLHVIAAAWLLKNPKPIKKIKSKVIIINKPQAGGMRAWPFIIIGVGVATAIGGAITAGLTLSSVGQRDELHEVLSAGSNPPSGEVAKLHRQAETFATTSYVLWATGGAIAVVGVILVATVGRKPPPKPIQPKNGNQPKTMLLWQGETP